MPTQIADIARAYLECTEPEKKTKLTRRLDAYDGDLSDVVRALRPRPTAPAPTGLLTERRFESERLARKYPEDFLPLLVPGDYDPGQARGLVLFLHGGGHSTPRESGRKVFGDYGITDLLEDSGFIVCTPTAPYNERSFASWNLPEVDEFLMDVIEEIQQFYSIDPDRVFLAGHSMGGMGALHVAQRMPDRFAGVLASGSSWDIGFWACLKGTSLWLLQGTNDAVMFRRRHGTDIDFARLLRQRLEQADIAHVYREHSGGHALTDGRRIVREWLQWARGITRNPLHPHVVAVSPRGCTPWIDWRRHPAPLVSHNSYIDFHDVADAPHAWWVSIERLGDETICYDVAHTAGCRDDCAEDWDNFRVTLKRKNARGGLVEAFRRDDGTIEVTAKNVTGFTLWLHPDMMDLSSVRVLVSGKEQVCGDLRPSLTTLLDSYLRRRDWGLLYPAKVTITDEDGAWTTKDQIGLR